MSRRRAGREHSVRATLNVVLQPPRAAAEDLSLLVIGWIATAVTCSTAQPGFTRVGIQLGDPFIKNNNHSREIRDDVWRENTEADKHWGFVPLPCWVDLTRKVPPEIFAGNRRMVHACIYLGNSFRPSIHPSETGPRRIFLQFVCVWLLFMQHKGSIQE